jgi:amino acid permease
VLLCRYRYRCCRAGVLTDPPAPPSCFAFGGSEVICVAASETTNPRRNIPKAVRRTFWRVVIFYVFGVLAIGVLVRVSDEHK